MGKVAVFHHISDEPSEDKMAHTIEQILNFNGQITFDGVYTSVFDNRLTLQGKSVRLFISGNQIGREGFCNRAQLEELRNFGFFLCWHGWSHRPLVELTDDDIRAELAFPKWILPVYAYPHGSWDTRVAKIVQEAGFIKAFSTTQGEEGNDFAIPREYI